LSELLPSSGLGPGSDEVGQKGLKLLLWSHSQKIRNQKPNMFFFNADSKVCRVFWGFEQLSSTIEGQVIHLARHVQTAWFRLKPTGSEGDIGHMLWHCIKHSNTNLLQL